MSSPLESPEFGDLYVGDPHDDDAQVIDALVKEVDAPATPVIERIETAPLIDYMRCGRLLTGTQVFDLNVNQPQLILPADIDRKHVRIEGYSLAVTPGATDYILIADDASKLSNLSATLNTGSGVYRLRHTKSHTLDDFTGAIFAYPGPGIATNNFELTWVAITK